MGRGSSKAGGGGNSFTALTKGHYMEGSPGQYTKEAATVLQGVDDVLKDFGMEDSLRGIYFNEKGVLMGADAAASMNGFGDITISTKYLARPEGRNSDFVSDTFYGTGAHEAGHAVIGSLLDKVEIEGDAKSQNLIKATARRKGKLEHEIIKEAKKRYGSNPAISKYGSTKEIEKIAEAVSDVYANKGKANPYSNVIVGVMKDINNGSFSPKLKVSKREMGI